MLKIYLIIWLQISSLPLLALQTSKAGTGGEAASPRSLPQAQAARFCQLFVNDGEGKVYPLSLYAQHLVTMLCGQPSYSGYTAEQVFTGLIFYYEDWIREPFILEADADRQMLVHELHSGGTLRIFPHKNGQTTDWYAPTDRIPATIDAEHRRYIQEVFSRLNSEVRAGNTKTVDAYIDRMLEYQCQFGGSRQASQPSLWAIIAIFFVISFAFCSLIRTFASKISKKCGLNHTE